MKIVLPPFFSEQAKHVSVHSCHIKNWIATYVILPTIKKKNTKKLISSAPSPKPQREEILLGIPKVSFIEPASTSAHKQALAFLGRKNRNTGWSACIFSDGTICLLWNFGGRELTYFLPESQMPACLNIKQVSWVMGGGDSLNKEFTEQLCRAL